MAAIREQNQITTRQLLAFSILFSLAAHFSLLFLSQWLPEAELRSVQEPSSIEVELLPARREVIESLQETATEAPEDADFASDRDLRADEEMSPDVSEQAPSESQPAPQTREILESFSLSEADREEISNPLLQERFDMSEAQRRFSPDFIERLNRGEELKVNAYGLDYAQYIHRMRSRIQHRWNPMSFFEARMKRFNSISTTLALVLNSSGEIVQLSVISPTLFPHYDSHAIEAVRNAAPFPNPPSSLLQDDERVYLTWNFVFFMSSRNHFSVE